MAAKPSAGEEIEESESQRCEEKDESSLEHFNISKDIISRLNSQGITSLFPIQQKVFKPIIEGNHIVAKARTGSGKTLAFLLPVFQALHTQQNTSKSPRALILVPTRELATQITSVVGKTVKTLKAVAVYGGVSISAQQQDIRNGVDLVIGTPGRTKDLINRGTLNFKSLQFVILDEVDRMMDMGFKDDVQEILDLAKEMCSEKKSMQFLFFSATLTSWVDLASKKYMAKDTDCKLVKIDMVGSDNLKTSKDVRHLAISAMKNSHPAIINDLIRMYSTGNDAKSIVFCERKVEVDELAMSPFLSSHKTQILHGDIPQAKREKVIKGFKDGSVNVLIATDVAARGLDIPKIDLVIQCSPPSDLESYVHRSGRTGRAGKKGIAICIHNPRDSQGLVRVERFAKFQFERINAPTNAEIIQSLANETIGQLDDVQDKIATKVVKLMDASLKGVSEENLKLKLAKAICLAAGVTKESAQSLLTNSKGCVTMLMTLSQAANSQGLFFVKLRDQVDNELVSKINSFALSQDRKSFAFDLGEPLVAKFTQQWIDSEESTLKVAETLPKMLPSTSNGDRNGGGGGGGRYGNQRNGGGGGGRFNGNYGNNNSNGRSFRRHDNGGGSNNGNFKRNGAGAFGASNGGGPKRTKF